MKNFHKALSILAAAALFAGCSSYDETNDPARAGNTSVKLLADVADDAETRAGISVGESTFTGYWEENDAMGILFTAPGSTPELRPFTYNNNDFAFEGELPTQSGAWQYMAFYPHATVNGTKASIPFGNLRTQSGNAFNCASDALVAPCLNFANAEPGKTDEGDPVRFTLNRLTSILNLEVKGGDNADKVRYLLLTSENETQTLSAASIDFDISDMGSGLAFSQTAPSNVIALGFEQGTAPDANDINAFFNIMPGSYDKLTVDVITAPRIGTVAIERGADKPFAAGKLYKRAETPVFAPLEAPSFDWPGDMRSTKRTKSPWTTTTNSPTPPPSTSMYREASPVWKSMFRRPYWACWAFRNSTCSTIPTSSRKSPSQISDSAARPKYKIKKSAFSTSRHSCR